MDIEVGDNVHGQFGLAADWPQHSQAVRSWLGHNAVRIEEVASALVGHTPLERSPSVVKELVDYAVDDLPKLIDEIARNSQLLQADLSDRLANQGILPMFGFPTRVRNLYYRSPLRSVKWPPQSVIDRPLDIAISQFAPGSEVVKDKAVYTAVGVVGYERKGNLTVEVDDPLGPPYLVGGCQHCQSMIDVSGGNLSPDQSTACPTCGSADYRLIPLSEPGGFRTDYRDGKGLHRTV